MDELTTILNLLTDTEALQSLIKAENQIDNNDNTLEFKNDNSHLKINITDNGISLSYEEDNSKQEEEEREARRKAFITYCDTLDDDFFDEVCETYTAVYGEGSLNSLNKEMSLQEIKQFFSIVKDIANENLTKYVTYRNGVSDILRTLD